jgi:acetyl esterase/lipase
MTQSCGLLAWLACSLLSCSTDPAESDDAGPPDGGDADTDGDTDSDTDTDTDLEIVVETDVPYTPPDGGDPDSALLDVYYLPDGEPKHLLVFVHGGSWVGGDKSNLELAPDLVPWFVERDFVVAAPNFRLASGLPGPQEITYADQCTDLAFALAWLDENGETYGVTEPGVVLLGYSSGAHLVALLAADEQYLQAAGLTHEHLAASISFDVHAYDVPYALQLMQGSELEENIPLIEFLFGETVAEQLVGSPANYAADAAVPPTLLISADPSAEETSKGYIALTTTQAYGELLVAADHQASWAHFDDETHSSLVLDFGTGDDGPTDEVAAFLAELPL